MGRGQGWKQSEMENLTKCYLSVSQDNVVGTNQSGETFWKRVHAEFLQNKGDLDNDRDDNKLKNMWSKINQACTKFDACLASAKRLNNSGFNEEKFEEEAMKMYAVKSQGKPFPYRFCYLLLQHSPKWHKMKSEQRAQTPKKLKIGEDVKPLEPDADDHDIISPQRPEGVKLAKSQLRKKRVAVDDEIKTLDLLQEYLTVAKRKTEEIELQTAVQVFSRNPDSAQSKIFFQALEAKIIKKMKVEEHEEVMVAPVPVENQSILQIDNIRHDEEVL